MLQVSRNCYYRWINKQAMPKESDKILVDIKRVFLENRKSYGSPRIYKQLKDEGIRCSRNRIARLMRDDGIVARRRKKYKKPVSKQRQTPVAENLLNREFKVHRLDSVWASDVSYFWTRKGWVHLAVVMDLYSRKIIGWSMGDRVDKELTINALRMALDRRGLRPVIHHSDQGAEYSNKDFQSLLKEHLIKPSMSRKANCYDNAVVESFFKTIKAELAYQQMFQDIDQARSAIFEYIEVFYNIKRLHSGLGYLSPVDYERINSVN